MISAKLAAPRSGEITLVGFDGKHFQLRSVDAFAPGQPLTVNVTLGSDHVLDLKSLGSVKREDGGFDIRARALTMPRTTRDALLTHFAVR